jgi:hypothetical protein
VKSNCVPREEDVRSYYGAVDSYKIMDGLVYRGSDEMAKPAFQLNFPLRRSR